MKHKIVLSSIWLCSVVGLLAEESSKRGFESGMADEVLDIIQKSQIVEVYRIEEKPYADRNVGIHGHRIVSGPLKPSEEWLGKLRSILLDRKAYVESYVKACPFLPGVALRFRSEGKVVDQLVCFSCQDIVTMHLDRYRNEDFNNVRPELLRLIKEIYPKDKEIQSLEEKPQGYAPWPTANPK